MFRDLGYETAIEKIIATDYLVPQKRVRVFLIGWRGGLSRWEKPSVLSVAKFLGMKKATSYADTTAKQALGDLPHPSAKGSNIPARYISEPLNHFSAFLRRKTNGSVSLHSMPTMSALDREFVLHIPPGGNYMNIPDKLSTARILKFKKTGGRTTTYGRLHPNKPAYTVNTYFNRPNVGTNYHYSQDRLITVREALRLQSFPDDFVPIHTSQRSLHMQVGNAVPPLLSYAIASSIKRMFGL
jgi:DNA (cytosine-5)-methyltransferase 1